MAASAYKWNYCSLGGVVRVHIASGEDIAHLGELDQKMWTVLSCPVAGLRFDGDTLRMLDTDGDGKIRVPEVVAAAEWLTSVIKDKDSILKGEAELRLDNINTDNEAGQKLYDSAKLILGNLKQDKDSITVAETSDTQAIFADTKANGDGVICEVSTDDEKARAAIAACMAQIGSTTDRSGKPGVTAEQIAAFYAALADFADWKAQEKGDVLPFGADTAAALAACEALQEKMADFFMRCKLISFNADAAAAVDVSVERIGAISAGNLAEQVDEIAAYPLARPNAEQKLYFDGINPAWKAAFETFKTLVLNEEDKKAGSLDEARWQVILSLFGPYRAWMAAKKGEAVEALGLEAVQAFLQDDRMQVLLDLVAEDVSYADEANAILEVNKLMHLYRDFYEFLRNYVLFWDFYSLDPAQKAMFQEGRLFIDQRCCELCVRVSDMGKHAEMAGLSGMFLIYCTCTSKVRNETMDIVAVMTAGGIKNLRPGKNAVFYDRDGQDWDATVIKIVENPISIRQAFWSPYRKFANFVSEKITKSAAEKEDQAVSGLQQKAETAPAAVAEDKKSAFDIAKFAGIFAAIGMALGYLGSFLTYVVTGATAKPMTFVLVILIIMLCISGPSCFLAWLKLRKRNLGPVLNANGWAINSSVLVNIVFGATLTSTAVYPRLRLKDPYKKKGLPVWLWCLIVLLVLAAAGRLVFLLGRKPETLPW